MRMLKIDILVWYIITIYTMIYLYNIKSYDSEEKPEIYLELQFKNH